MAELFSLADRAFYQVARFQAAVENSGGRLYHIKTRDDLKSYNAYRLENQKITAGVLGIEGLHALGGNIDNVDQFYNLGVRIMVIFLLVPINSTNMITIYTFIIFDRDYLICTTTTYPVVLKELPNMD